MRFEEISDEYRVCGYCEHWLGNVATGQNMLVVRGKKVAPCGNYLADKAPYVDNITEGFEAFALTQGDNGCKAWEPYDYEDLISN